MQQIDDPLDAPDDDPCDAAGRALAHSVKRFQAALTREMVRARLFADEAPRMGRFELQRTLGRGATCTVFLGFDREFDRSVALKVLRPERCPGPDAEQRWEREARALARISHPNVVQLYERGTHDGQFYLAMEYVRGCTLTSWLAQPRPPAAIVAMFVEVGRGLQAAHWVGLLHRDFKPDNVIVGQDGRPRIVDFGIACMPDDARASEESAAAMSVSEATSSDAPSIAGTPAYMSPEQCRGESIDARSDQFSFCLALYEALFGRPPYDHGHVARLLYERATGRLHPVPADPSVPAHVRTAIARGLSLDPNHRWPSMNVLLAALTGPRANIGRRRARGLSNSLMLGLSVAALVSSSCRTFDDASVPRLAEQRVESAPADGGAKWARARRPRTPTAGGSRIE